MGAAVLAKAFLVVTAVWLHRVWRTAVTSPAALFVVAVSASRALLGVHFLTDVIAGVLAGPGWVAGEAVAVPPHGRRRNPRPEELVIS